MKFKILHLNQPITKEKLLCDFLDGREANTKIGNHIGTPFDLQSRVPQGSVLSLTLLTTYTRDIPKPSKGFNLCYADDITRVVGYHGRSKEVTNKITAKEITINKFGEN